MTNVSLYSDTVILNSQSAYKSTVTYDFLTKIY